MISECGACYLVSVTLWRVVTAFIWTIEKNVTEPFLWGIESRTFYVFEKIVSMSNAWRVIAKKTTKKNRFSSTMSPYSGKLTRDWCEFFRKASIYGPKQFHQVSTLLLFFPPR